MMTTRNRLLLPASAALGIGVASGLLIWRGTTARRPPHTRADQAPAFSAASTSLPYWARWGMNEKELFRDLNHLPH